MVNVNWKNDASGLWTTASEWDDNVVPDSVDDFVTLATKTNAYVVTYENANDVVGTVYVDKGATLSIASGTLTIGGTNQNGNLYDTGIVDVASGATLAFSGPYAEIVGGGTLAVAGTLEFEAGSYPGLFGGKIALVGGSIVGSASQTDPLIAIDDSISGYGTIGNGWTVSTGGSNQTDSPGLFFQINNGAAIVATGAAGHALTLNTGANFIENGGLIEATGAGGLVLDSSLWQDGSMIVAAKSAITFADGADVGGNGLTQVLAGGELVLNDGLYASDGMLNIGSATATGGTVTTTAGNIGATADELRTNLYNYGAIKVVANSELMVNFSLLNGSTGQLDLNGGTAGAAIVELVASGASIRYGSVALTNSANNEFISNGGYIQLSNYSTIAGSGVIGDGYLRLFNGGTGVIDADGTVGLTIKDDDLGFNQNTETNFTNYNDGLMEATAAGTVASELGLLTFNAGFLSNGGEILAAKQGKVVFDGTSLNGGGGQVEVAAGGQMLIEAGAQIYNQSDLSIALGGTLSTASDGATDEIETTLLLTGSLDISANSDLLTDSKWVGSGVVNLGGASGGATLTIDVGNALDILGGATINLLNANDKIVSAGAGAQFRNRGGDAIVGEGVIGDANLNIVNTLGGTIDATGALTLGSTAQNASQIQNGGLLEATGSGVLTLASNVNSTGDIKVTSGAKIIAEQNVYNVGRVDLDGGSAEFASVCNSQIYFDAGKTSSLIFDDLSSYNGNIAGFTTGDTIDLKNFKFGDGAFQNQGGYSGLDGYAVFKNSLGQTSQGFALDGNYTASAGTFTFTEDAGGGTVIHWTAKT